MTTNDNDRNDYGKLKATIMQYISDLSCIALLILSRKLKAERNIEIEVKALDKQLRGLRRQSKLLSLKSAKEQSATRAAITEYATQDCRKLCDTIIKRFPREIRDMIYRNIHGEAEIYLKDQPHSGWLTPRMGRAKYLESESEYHLRTGYLSPVENYLWSAEYLGKKFMRELAGQYFQSACFDFGDDWSFIQKFRITDQWKLGWVPGEFATNVKIRLDCSEHVYKEWPVIETSPWHSTGAGWDLAREQESDPFEKTRSRSKLLEAMENLFGFKRGTKIKVQLQTSFSEREPSPAEEQMFRAMAPIIFPTLRRLFDAGIIVTLVCSHEGDDYPDLPIAMTADHHDLESYERDFVRVSYYHTVKIVCQANNVDSASEHVFETKERSSG